MTITIKAQGADRKRLVQNISGRTRKILRRAHFQL